jgi:hypothetical protein
MFQEKYAVFHNTFKKSKDFQVLAITIEISRKMRQICNEIKGANIQPLPFLGAIYSMENGDNIYVDSQTNSEIKGEIVKRGLKFFVDKISKYRFSLLTKSIANDFGTFDILPSLN